MGYKALDDLIANENFHEKFLDNLRGDKFGFDPTMVYKQFPCITVGYFPTVDLYDGTSGYSETKESEVPQIPGGCIPSCVDENWVGPNCMGQASNSLYEEILKTNAPPYSLEEKFDESTLYSQSPYRKTDTRNGLQMTTEEETCSSTGSEAQKATLSVSQILDKDINCVPGLNKRQLSRLEKCGFHTLRKLLHHFPRTYADLQNAEVEIDDGQYLIFVGQVISSRNFFVVPASPANLFLEVFRINIGKETWCASVVRLGNNKDHFEMREYNIDVLEDEGDSSVYTKGRPYPIYPSKKGLNPEYLRDILSRALKTLPADLDPLPKYVTEEFGLLHLSDAYIGIHKPGDFNEADLARRRLIFDEFFYLQLARLFQMLESVGTIMEKDALLDRYMKPEINASFMEDWCPITRTLMKVLPYTLTPSQLRATSEIIWDLKRPVPMNRLLQGDVGCGKTVVAFLACMEVIGSGYQAAFMVPTELLAFQHYEHLLGLLERIDEAHDKPSVALLTGSTPAKEARFIRKGLQLGDISLVIGTHSLIAEKVEFSALRIAVVDEQHRFGVVQRGRFNSKVAILHSLDIRCFTESIRI
ncbi:DEAD/DEAH box RNA helicase family protein isoform 1 [Dorcoceras hygrometricum]|uniref:DEAD/DEAH box RNA helicase family protein isoform 1 n=1 Tax=Dorcoceras hygrometricum TaxID=472368 RepID=A0A2Z7DDK2_9LAMI|nr:DEAD/DEAH box RNA helicase family protein isoform 1 [Dorcoceras hygrometricum]